MTILLYISLYLISYYVIRINVVSEKSRFSVRISIFFVIFQDIYL